MESSQPYAEITRKIDKCLPQTQCTMCGFPRCFDYAEALAQGTTDINRCPPGGKTTIRLLANLLQQAEKSLADDCTPFISRKVARIRELDCIGCTLCIAPCPVDAIIGTAKHMHSVLESECSGCGLCLQYCPVDCIEMDQCSIDVDNQVWNQFRNTEVSHWRDLANRRQRRIKGAVECQSIHLEKSEMLAHIRDAVNRERSKRWKKVKRQARKYENSSRTAAK